MNEITKELLEQVSDYTGEFKGAYNIREDGCSVARKSSENIKIEPLEGKSGLEIHVAPGTKGESVSIPACITHGNQDDLTYNDFYIGEGADVTIVAGCGIHTKTGEAARHNGVHRFFLGKGSRVVYIEKHIGTGKGTGIRTIDPITEAELDEDSILEIDSAQLRGVDRTKRVTKVKVAKGARLVVRERLFTDKEQQVDTEFYVELNGEGAGADVISRSVAKDKSYQKYVSTIVGNAPCTGHTECDAIIDGEAVVDAAPTLSARHTDAALIHEAAIGKIAGEQIMKLRTLGLTEEEAEARIVEGFLS